MLTGTFPHFTFSIIILFTEAKAIVYLSQFVSFSICLWAELLKSFGWIFIKKKFGN